MNQFNFIQPKPLQDPITGLYIHPKLRRVDFPDGSVLEEAVWQCPRTAQVIRKGYTRVLEEGRKNQD